MGHRNRKGERGHEEHASATRTEHTGLSASDSRGGVSVEEIEGRNNYLSVCGDQRKRLCQFCHL